MCGIAGQFTFAPRVDTQAHEAVIRAMTALMARRGPDDEGHFADRHCTLGFRRLSILDLSSAGHQPMTSFSGRYVIVFNGEVYNFRQLAAELESGGVRFRSRTDTEVVLEALAQWGPDALRRF